MEREDSIQNGDLKSQSKANFVKKLTLRMKGNHSKSKPPMGTAAFSDLVNGTARGTHSKNSVGDFIYDFKVSEIDNSGKRTLRSVHGTALRKDPQVLYMANIDIDSPDEKGVDSSSRPALTNVFPGATVGGDSRGAGVEERFEDDEEAPGMFNRPNFGNISFLNRFNHTNSFQAPSNVSLDVDNAGFENGGVIQNGFGVDDDDMKRLSSGTEYTDSPGGQTEMSPDLPWNEEDVDELADEEDYSEYTPVIMFLEGCGLKHYTHLFLDGDVDMDALLKLTNQDFHDMGLPIGPRRKLMDAIQRRRIVLNEPAQMYDSQL